MNKLQMKTPLVEMDGDEMTRIVWQQIKDILLLPYIDLKTEYFDLGLPNRDKTDDAVTVQAANRTRELGVAVKCATITPNVQRVEEYKLKQAWKSPNATIRSILDGTVFRIPIIPNCVTPYIRQWKKPITIARHAYGDIYKNVELRIEGPCRAELCVSMPDGTVKTALIHQFKAPGIIQGVHNLDDSITNFARTVFNYALEKKQDLWFGTKDTISKTYDHRFKDIFNEMFEKEYEEKFKAAGICYFYSLIDDIAARIVRSEGGFVWACQNYDGDVMSDLVAAACGSVAMMSSVLVSPDGKYEFEAAHGTVTRHYYKHLKGEKTSTNPVATISAWSGAIRKRAEFDNLPKLARFADILEEETLLTIESGVMTGDLKDLVSLEHIRIVDTETFLQTIAARVEARI